MDELRSLAATLRHQRRRLQELVEICGGYDLSHPLQRFAVRRIVWLEEEIDKIKKQK